MKEKQTAQNTESKQITYSMLTQALAEDCFVLYYVDLESGDFLEFIVDPDSENEPEGKPGSGFFDEHQQSILQNVHEEDLVVFQEAFSKETMIRKLEQSKVFMWVYRYKLHGKYTWVSSKISYMRRSKSHLIIGINNIDAQVRNQEGIETERSERSTYSRISALSGDFLCIFTVNPSDGSYVEYGISDRSGVFGSSTAGEDFFGWFRRHCEKIIHPDDLDMFLTVFTEENVQREIQENGLFLLDYRILENGQPKYVTMKGAIAEEKDGPHLLFGIVDVDSQVKREQEFIHNLSVARNKANLDALTGVRNKHAYIDLEAELNRRIENNEPVSFAIVACDLNDVKKINDTLGHHAGDRYIMDGCTIICNTFKHSPVFRIGGDEFAVIAQGMDYEQIEDRMNALQQSNAINRKQDGIVIACGMARYSNQKNFEAVFEQADALMYQNKRMLKESVVSNVYIMNDMWKHYIEESPVPISVFQFLDEKVLTLAFSHGFSELFRISEADDYHKMHSIMCQHVHPDDLAPVSDAISRFAAGSDNLNVVYRYKMDPDKEYCRIHASARYMSAEDGSRLAVVWYMKEP